MSAENFEQWLERFVAFQKECGKTLGKPVPDDVAVLKFESQQLEPMLYHAEEHAAQGIRHYYERKSVEMKKMELRDWPLSGLDGPAKAASHRQLWGRESAERLVKVIVSRGFKVSQALKLMEGK